MNRFILLKIWLISLCLQLCSFIQPVYASVFLPGTNDVPLMDDFQISREETFWMDDTAGEGRIFFSKAFSNQEEDSIRQFYEQTLPQLGWQQQEDGLFIRENDSLKIALVNRQYHKGHLTTVIFELISK